MGPVHQFQPLTHAAEHDRMLSRNITGAPGLNADLFICSLADHSLSPINADFFEITIHRFRQDLSQPHGCSAWGILLEPVMHLKNFHIVVIT